MQWLLNGACSCNSISGMTSKITVAASVRFAIITASKRNDLGINYVSHQPN